MPSLPPSAELAFRRTLFYFLLLFAYLLIGALIFTTFSIRPSDRLSSEQLSRLDMKRAELLNVLWAETVARGENDWYRIANQKMDNYEKILQSHQSYMDPNTNDGKFSGGFQTAFKLVTTIGPIDTDELSTAGRIFAFFYAMLGVPMALLYLGQCNRLLQSVLGGGWNCVAALLVMLFFGGILYDIAESGNDETSFSHDLLSVFLLCSTVGEEDPRVSGFLDYLISLVGLSLASVVFIHVQHIIERRLQSFELSFSRMCGQVSRWREKANEENDRIPEEDEEESYTD